MKFRGKSWPESLCIMEFLLKIRYFLYFFWDKALDSVSVFDSVTRRKINIFFAKYTILTNKCKSNISGNLSKKIEKKKEIPKINI